MEGFCIKYHGAGSQGILTELLTADKRGEKTKLVSAESKLQINHPTMKRFSEDWGCEDVFTI